MNLKSKLPPRFQKYASFGIIPKLLLAPIAFLILCGFLLAKPFVQFRLYRMVDSRIGHLATNTEIVRLRNLEHNKNAKKKEIIVYCSENWYCSNNALRKLFFRNSFHLRGPLAWLALWMSRKIKIFRSFKSTRNSPLIIDRSGLIERSPSKLIFSKSELEIGEKFLKSCRVFDEKFVTLHIRDSAYLAHLYGRIDPKHDYRNSNINSYILAAENLAEMGYTVFRMGAIVKEQLKSRHPRVIDYATNGMRTEFLDIFLGAKCQFTISTGSGWDGVPTIFSRPTMFVNQLPIFAPSIVTLPIISYPKTLIDSKTGNRPSLSELISRNLANRFNSYAYTNLGVEIEDLSSDEIAEAATEMANRVMGKFKETQEEQHLQAKLRKILSTHPSLQPSPNYFPIRGIFASTFLKNNPDFVL